MRKFSFCLIVVLGLLAAAAIPASASGKDAKKPKNSGTLTVKTGPASYPVSINGEYVGMSGVDKAAEFYLPPGKHRLEIEFPRGKKYSEVIEIVKNRKNCICLTYVENEKTSACPYNVRVDVQDQTPEGDLVTFAAFNSVSGSVTPLNYRWRVTPENARITSGQGTSAITVDTTGLAGKTIRAELDVWDDVYDKQCRQKNEAETYVKPFEKPKPEAVRCDIFETRAFDDDKARFDNCVIQLNGVPDGQLYIIIYQGTDRASMTRNTYDKMSKRTLDYLVKERAVDPRKISIIRGNRMPLKTTYELWIVPPGADLPLPQ